MRFKWRLCLSLVLLMGCQKKEEHVEEHFTGQTVDVREPGVEFQVPAKAWDVLLITEADKQKKAEKKKSSEEGDLELTTASFIYAPIEVRLIEKNQGTLREKEIRIHLPDGGGEIDFAKWVIGTAGTFFVRFLWEGQDEQAQEKHVLFYSRARKRRVGDQTVGSGCKSLLDLTSYVMKENKKEGLVVNATRNFHTTVLGGHFLFSWMKDGTRKVARVSFTDSNNTSYFCGNEK